MDMNTEQLEGRYQTVCAAPSGNGFRDDKERYRGVSIKMCTDFMHDEKDPGSLSLKYDFFHVFDAPPYYIIDADTAVTLDRIVEAMEREEHENQAFGNIDMLKALLRMFLINVLRYGSQAQGQQAYELKPARMLFLQFRQAVERHYREKHSVQDYADLLNVAARTLNKCVNDCSGHSPLPSDFREADQVTHCISRSGRDD